MKNRNILVLVVAVFIGLGIYGSVLQSSHSGKTKVTITVVADKPRLIINGKQSKPGEIYLRPGGYSITAEASGFQSAQKNIVVGKEPLAANFLLTPKDQHAQQWSIQHNKEYLEAEKSAGSQTQAEGEAFIATNPIVRYLPLKTSYYAINYRMSDKGQAILQISAATPLGRQVAIEKIHTIGFDPTDYQVEFTDVKNPFITGSKQ